MTFKLIKSIVIEIWRIIPFSFFITVLARLLIVSTILLYLESIGSSSFLVSLILNLWALIPLYISLRNTYYEMMRNQSPTTILWNSLEDSIRNLDKASKKRIIATKQRIWVQRNPEIHIFNYWFLKHLRKKEWMNIKLKQNSNSMKGGKA